MRLFCVLCFCLLLPSPVAGETPIRDAIARTRWAAVQPVISRVESKPVRVCVNVGITLHIVTQMLDLSTTMYGIGTGQFSEANPALKWAADDPLEMGLAKGTMLVGSSFSLIKLAQKHPKVACGASLLMSGLTGYVAARNYNNIQAWRRDR